MISTLQTNSEKSNDNEQIMKKTHPRAKFTQSEDELLIKLVETIGTNDWQSISHQMPGRNPRQCRDRWQNYLSPDVVNGPWTSEEEELLVKKFEELGPSWKQIAMFFPTRTDINIKSRWHLRERRLKKEDLQMKKALLRKKVGPMNPVQQTFNQNIYQSSTVDFLPQMQYIQNHQFIHSNNSIQAFPMIQPQKIQNIPMPIQKVKSIQTPVNVMPSINSEPLPFFSQKTQTVVGNEKEITIQPDEIFDSATNDCLSLLLMNEDNNVFDNVFENWF